MSGGSFSASGRGWSDRALLLAGVAVLAILGLVTGLLLAKSKGYLEDTVKVDAQLMNVGDGLPERADVKFRGMLVGAVTSVTPAEDGKPNIVHIDLKSEHAERHSEYRHRARGPEQRVRGVVGTARRQRGRCRNP